ncbi:DUF1858 domain-containing protein [Tepidamorphus sp. 3E244]|uniref:DUF1858 domain-containing protein n=1 Tax=Tepidamorphus sp. 3E244 TaxID=3385498 RepID=UPI0038FC47D3
MMPEALMATRKRRSGTISPSTKMDELLTGHPEVIAVMNRNRMLCVGCLLASFHDTGDAAREHGLDPDALFEEIAEAIERSQRR